MAPATQPVGREKEDTFREHEELGPGLYIRGPRDHCFKSGGENSRPNITRSLWNMVENWDLESTD